MIRLTSESTYALEKFYLDARSSALHKKVQRSSALVMVKCRMLSTTSTFFATEVGKVFPMRADKILMGQMNYECRLAREERQKRFGALFAPSSHPAAEERSRYFASLVKSRLPPSSVSTTTAEAEVITFAPLPENPSFAEESASSASSAPSAPLVVTLDGYMRNTMALLAAGVPETSIVVLEMLPTTALYHRLLKMAMDWRIHTIWTGNDQRRANKGFQTYLQSDKLLAKYGLDAQRIEFLYADFCGDVPRNMGPCLRNLGSLRVLGLTQGKRNCRDTSVIDEVAASWGLNTVGHKPEELERYDQRSVRCTFFERKV